MSKWSAVNKNRLPVNSSIRIGSIATLFLETTLRLVG